MKSIFATIFALTIILITSCTHDSNSSELSDSLDGRWNLSNVSGGFAGVDIDYEQGLVSWNFNPGTLILTVENSVINNGPQSTFLPVQSGDYAYIVLEFNGNKYLTIEGVGIYENGEFGRFEINEAGDMIIDQGESSEGEAADVYILSFLR